MTTILLLAGRVSRRVAPTLGHGMEIYALRFVGSVFMGWISTTACTICRGVGVKVSNLFEFVSDKRTGWF
jgi:hypothetical protein